LKLKQSDHNKKKREALEIKRRGPKSQKDTLLQPNKARPGKLPSGQKI
jgi:hypothetical protein